MFTPWKGQVVGINLTNQTLNQKIHLGWAHPPLCALPTGARPTYTLTLDLFSNVVSAQIDRNIKHKSSCFKTPR